MQIQLAYAWAWGCWDGHYNQADREHAAYVSPLALKAAFMRQMAVLTMLQC